MKKKMEKQMKKTHDKTYKKKTYEKHMKQHMKKTHEKIWKTYEKKHVVSSGITDFGCGIQLLGYFVMRIIHVISICQLCVGLCLGIIQGVCILMLKMIHDAKL